MQTTPKTALLDLVGVLLRTDKEGALARLLYNEGISDAYQQSMAAALQALGAEGIATMAQRYEVKVPSALLAEMADEGTEIFPGATRQEIDHVMMQDIVGDYDTPDTIPEWTWVEKVASYGHVKNGKEGGVWEFVLNLSLNFEDIPEKLVPVIQSARKADLAYLIFHQGT